MNKLVSIITCTYRKFDTIYETIDSVLGQDYPNIEYIIADDGSENFPQYEIEEYINTNNKGNISNRIIYTNKENVGTVRNLNKAYKIAKGEYIVVVAGDDIFASSNVVSLIVNRMKENNYEILATSRLCVDSERKAQFYLPHCMYRKKINKLTREEQYSKFISGQFYAMFSGSALAYKKSLIVENGYYDEKYILWEDGPFIRNILSKRKIEVAFDIVSVIYSLDGVSGTNPHPQLEKDMNLYNKTDRYESINELDSFYKKLALLNMYQFKRKVRLLIMHPSILIYKIIYKLQNLLYKEIDKIIIKKRIGII